MMERSTFDAGRHVKYWIRCLKSLLPTDYTSMDSSRMALGFFILAGLDLLGAGADTLPAAEMESLGTWVLKCQHPNGGFCGSPNHRYPDSFYDPLGTYDVDPANLPATFFALLTLNFVGDIAHVNRAKCLKWLKKLQRADGSFGELIGEDGKIMGGRDMRYCHFASAVRWILRGELKAIGEGYEDIDVDALVKHIQSAQTYDGGIGESFEHESHAGYTYTGIASLAFLDRLPESLSKTGYSSEKSQNSSDRGLMGLRDSSEAIRWLLCRQLAFDDPEDDDDDEADEETVPVPKVQEHTDVDNIPSLARLSLEEMKFVGCSGRVNKRADTCYCYWVAAALDILGQGKLINAESTRSFLLDKTQHRIGGFGKAAGYPPDLYHSYLGLATLALMKEPGIKELDPVLCVSVDAKKKIERNITEATKQAQMHVENGFLFSGPSESKTGEDSGSNAGNLGPDDDNGTEKGKSRAVLGLGLESPQQLAEAARVALGYVVP